MLQNCWLYGSPFQPHPKGGFGREPRRMEHTKPAGMSMEPASDHVCFVKWRLTLLAVAIKRYTRSATILGSAVAFEWCSVGIKGLNMRQGKAFPTQFYHWPSLKRWHKAAGCQIVTLPSARYSRNLKSSYQDMLFHTSVLVSHMEWSLVRSGQSSFSVLRILRYWSAKQSCSI